MEHWNKLIHISPPSRTQIYFFPLRRYHLKNKNEPESVSVVKNGISQIPSLEHHPETPLPNGKVLPENLYGLGNLLRFGRSNSYTDGLVHRSQSMTGKCHYLMAYRELHRTVTVLKVTSVATLQAESR
jgi:hypothetical protein